MFLQVALIALALLRLGGAQECGGFVVFLTLTSCSHCVSSAAAGRCPGVWRVCGFPDTDKLLSLC